jgi:hypothetical protein
VKFIFADTLDYVDPAYDFAADQSGAGREAYWDDQYPHEHMEDPPYDGMLVSRAALEKSGNKSGKYTEAQAMAFRRLGARAFLRLDGPRFRHMPLFGDCGAFAYAKEHEPPYTPEDMLAFYEDGEFTHGCSVDHIIFAFHPDEDFGHFASAAARDDARRRYDITLANAERFLRASRPLGPRFTPLGVVQGWSPATMAAAARSLCRMGYRYLALGGTAPLRTPQVKACLTAVRDAIPPEVALHVLGFAKAEDIQDFTGFGIASFDTTSPFKRAFSDERANYFLRRPGSSGLDYYTAIRVPQATKNPKLKRLARTGAMRQEALQALERTALDALRAYDRREAGIGETLDAVLAYDQPELLKRASGAGPSAHASRRERYRRTLVDRPWERCACRVCRELSIEVVLFRASNRNKRRGIHNLQVFKSLVDDLPGPEHEVDGQALLFGSPGAPEPHTPGALVRG